MVRRLIMDIVFSKWWSGALLRPNEYGITKVCSPEKYNSDQMVAVKELLENVFYGTAAAPENPYPKETSDYMRSKQYA